jgi:hypothetical protein
VTDQASTRKIRLICGCCAAPLDAFVVSVVAEETIYGIIPCKCKGIPPTPPEKARVIMLDFHRAKRVEMLKSKKK